MVWACAHLGACREVLEREAWAPFVLYVTRSFRTPPTAGLSPLLSDDLSQGAGGNCLVRTLSMA